MSIQFRDETFRDDYTFRNSPWAIQRFPFPFHEDSYMYSVNMEQHRGGPAGSVYEKRFDVDEHYVSEMRDRAQVLKEDPLRCQSLPHMTLAGWDTLELLMTSKAGSYPEHFELHRDGDRWRIENAQGQTLARLARAFAPPGGTDEALLAQVETEEGWILGA